MISKYSNFLIDKLLESVMISSADFISIMANMPRNMVCDRLYGIIDSKRDVKTNYNLIGLSDKNDEISFIPDSQYQRFKEKGENPWTKTKSKSKIGRMVRQVLIDNEYTVTDAQIEEFVNLFKAEWDKRNSTTRKMDIVSGDKILYWYNQDNYYGSGGTLGNSCMRGADKNNFMKIYADNPDKISMVILTEDDKLLARAILWKLDESTNGKKMFLDRVYYRNDSDYRYVHDWVLENIAKGDEKIFGSYNKFPGGEMVCKLKNVKFEQYPYADTFFYLYKRLAGGKLAGDGIISNVNKNYEYKDFVGSYLQDTAGREDIQTHRYSNSLDVYIKKDEAVYIDSLESFIYKKDAKFCTYLNSWYLENEVTYSDVVKTWIPNNSVIDHPKYGIIPKEYLIDVITEYTGSETTVLSIYKDISSDYQKCTKSEKMLKDSNEYFRSGNSPVYGLRNYDVKIRVSDMWGYDYPNFICFKMYKVKNEDEFSEMVDKFKIPFISRYGPKITKETADFFNIPIEETTQYIYPTDYTERLDIEFYFDYLKIKDKIKASEEITSKHDLFMTELHNFKYRTSGSYKENADIHEVNKKMGKDKYELLKDIIEKSVEETIKNIGPDVLNRAMADSGGNTLNEDEFAIAIKLIPLSYLYYLYTDSYGSSYHEVIKFLKSKGHNISSYVAEVSASVVVYELKYAIRDVFDKKLRIILDNLKLEIGVSDFKSYLLRNYNQEKIYAIWPITF